MKKPRITYDELDDVVMMYKDGHPEAAEKLIDNYRGFIAIYKNLLCDGTIYPNNVRMRQFIGLFIMRYEVRKSLDKYNYMPNVKRAIYSTAKMISDNCKCFSKTEINHELIIILLDMAKRYTRGKNPTFHTYVEKGFNYRLKKRIEDLIKDPLIRNDWLSYIDQQYEDTAQTNIIESDVVIESIQQDIDIRNCKKLTIAGSGLNLNWINGITATGIFKKLSPLERQILIMYYAEKKGDEEIAIELGYRARETVNRKRNKAKAIIEEHIKKNHLYKEDKPIVTKEDSPIELDNSLSGIKVYYAELIG